MNWLAHVHLSEPTPAFRLGNVLPDLVPARELSDLPADMRRGVERHHRIDAFTDAHPCFRRSVARLSPAYRRFGGIIVDVLYDHFLTARWSDYSGVPLRSCVDDFYSSFDTHRTEMPESVWPVLQRMREQDWLGSYGDLAGVRLALWRIGHRLRKPRDLGASESELAAQYDVFRADFEEFFPKITAYLAGLQRARLNQSTSPFIDPTPAGC